MDAQSLNSDTSNKNMLKFFPPNPNGQAVDISPSFIAIKEVDANKATNASDVHFKSSEKSGVTAFSNIEQNSRSNFKITSSKYVLKWNAEVNKDHAPTDILAVENRILVEALFWQLFDGNGKMIKTDKRGTSHLMIDERLNKFFYINTRGELAGNNLKDGSNQFTTSLSGGDEYTRPLMILQENRMIIAGVERQLDPHMHYLASKSTVLQVDMTNVLKEEYNPKKDYAGKSGVLYFPSRDLVAAAFGDNFVVAYPGSILILDSTSKILKAYSATFTPLAISTDDGANIYLLVETEKGKFVWKLNSEGERLFSLKTEDAKIYPPIIGFDGKVYIPSGKNILVFDSIGNRGKSIEIKSNLYFALVTRDNNLLIADGSQLILSDGSEELKILFDTGSDQFCTAPVISEAGNIFVASKQFLYCLTAK